MRQPDRRWIEVVFYISITDILFQNQDWQDVLNAIHTLNFNKDYDESKIIELAEKVLSMDYFRPMKEEFLILARYSGIKEAWLSKKIRYAQSRIRTVLKRHSSNVHIGNPRLTEEETEELLKFLKAFDNFRNLGIPANAYVKIVKETVKKLKAQRIGDEPELC